jgi:hypothetical protein
LSRIELAGSAFGRQGLRRRLGFDAIRTIDLVESLGRAGVAATRGLALANGMTGSPDGRIDLSDALSMAYSRPHHEADLKRRLAEAAERVTPRKRGRPPRS